MPIIEIQHIDSYGALLIEVRFYACGASLSKGTEAIFK